MKIAILCPYSYPSICGVWTRVYNDAKYLVSKGHEVHILSSNEIKGTDKKSKFYEFYQGIHIHRFPFKKITEHIRFFDFKHETLKYVLILILVYSIILGPLFALGKQLTFLPEKHNEIITTADYIRAITSEEDRILGDNNAVAFYSNRKKAGNIYDSSRAYMYAKVKIISDQDKIDIIKNKKPLVVYIYDSRYDFLEKMDFFNEFYSKINQIGDYRVYKLNA